MSERRIKNSKHVERKIKYMSNTLYRNFLYQSVSSLIIIGIWVISCNGSYSPLCIVMLWVRGVGHGAIGGLAENTRLWTVQYQKAAGLWSSIILNIVHVFNLTYSLFIIIIKDLNSRILLYKFLLLLK